MLDQPTQDVPPLPPPESYGRIVARPAVVLALLAGVWAWQLRARPEVRPQAAPPKPTAPMPSRALPRLIAVEPTPEPPPKPKPPPRQEPVAPALDEAAVARAEAALDQATRDRARAEARLADAERALQAATVQAASDRAASKSIAGRVRDPSARIAAASARGGFLRGERDRLKKELAALARTAPPKTRALMAKSAVAKPTEGTEYHFEIRRNRVSFVDLDRLVEMVKTDARLRLRVGGNRGRLASTVGPVGSFSLHYEMGRAIPDALAEMMEGRETSYNLLGWELIPESPNRGESLETTRSPSSEYARAIHQLSPTRDTITMWIYPDGFPLYRQLRDELHARGFLVAARPLPEGTAIRGSPVGSLSAGQ